MLNQPSDSSRYLKVRWDKNDIFHSVPYVYDFILQYGEHN